MKAAKSEKKGDVRETSPFAANIIVKYSLFIVCRHSHFLNFLRLFMVAMLLAVIVCKRKQLETSIVCVTHPNKALTRVGLQKTERGKMWR